MVNMLTRKERYIREIHNQLQQALSNIDDLDTNTVSPQEIRAAAIQVSKASFLLRGLESIMEHEQD